MQAGREMDALVAEMVMGYQWQDGALQHDDLPGGGRCHPRSVMNPPPPYSTSIEAAWQVVEKLQDIPGYELLDIRLRRKHGVAIMTDAGSCMKCLVTADTAPLAICLAALKAVGVEVV